MILLAHNFPHQNVLIFSFKITLNYAQYYQIYKVNRAKFIPRNEVNLTKPPFIIAII